MFDSRDDALQFRSELVAQLDRIDTDGWHVSPGLEGATIRLGDATARVRGHLVGEDYRVTACDTDPGGNWASELEVRPS